MEASLLDVRFVQFLLAFLLNSTITYLSKRAVKSAQNGVSFYLRAVYP